MTIWQRNRTAIRGEQVRTVTASMDEERRCQFGMDHPADGWVRTTVLDNDGVTTVRVYTCTAHAEQRGITTLQLLDA